MAGGFLIAGNRGYVNGSCRAQRGKEQVARFQAGNTGPHRAPWATWARVSPDSLMEDGLLEYPERHHAIAESCRPEALRGKALRAWQQEPLQGPRRGCNVVQSNP